MQYLKSYFVLAIILLLALNNVAIATTKQVNTSEMQKIILENKGNINFVILDVSPTQAYNSSHLEGAIPLPANDPSFEAKMQALDKNKVYLVYCHRMNWTPQAVAIMEKNNFNNIFASIEGKAGWINAGNPVVSK